MANGSNYYSGNELTGLFIVIYLGTPRGSAALVTSSIGDIIIRTLAL